MRIRHPTSEVIAGKPGGAWVERAALSLHHNGFCVLRRSQVSPELCSTCSKVALQRLTRLLNYTRDTGVDEVLYQFESRQICQRGACSRRYDMDMSPDVLRGADDERADAAWAEAQGTADEREAEISAWAQLQSTIDPLVRPIVASASRRQQAKSVHLHAAANAPTHGHRLRRWWQRQRCLALALSSDVSAAKIETPAAGCVVSLPQAREQNIHSDGAAPGLINAFIPLVDITAANGGTSLLPRTHASRVPLDRARENAPLLRAGDVLLFDYRIQHHGLPNVSQAPRPIAYIVYSANGVRDRHNFPAVHLSECCARICERNARLDSSLAVLRSLRTDTRADEAHPDRV